MASILPAVIVLGCIGAVCALLLIIAAKYMAVPVDSKAEALRECLPGANCGGCGYAGCDGYAAALAEGSETAVNKCVAGGTKTGKRLAALMGSEFTETVRKVAVIHCVGECGKRAKTTVETIGTDSCAAVRLTYGGTGSCAFGCIGYGDCVAACPEQAICIINGIACVNPGKCIGCGKCVRTCPQRLISLIEFKPLSMVKCSNHQKGAQARAVCEVSCIGCGLCVRKCETTAIGLKDNLAIIDPDKCTACGSCVSVCPRGAIKMLFTACN